MYNLVGNPSQGALTRIGNRYHVVLGIFEIFISVFQYYSMYVYPFNLLYNKRLTDYDHDDMMKHIGCYEPHHEKT